MKSISMMAALAAGSVALLAATSAQAGNPVTGVGVSVEVCCGGITDAKGNFSFANVRSGNYVIKLSGRPMAGMTGAGLAVTVNGRAVTMTCEAGVCRSGAMPLSGKVTGVVETR